MNKRCNLLQEVTSDAQFRFQIGALFRNNSTFGRNWNQNQIKQTLLESVLFRIRLRLLSFPWIGIGTSSCLSISDCNKVLLQELKYYSHQGTSTYEAVYGISSQGVKAARLTFSKFWWNLMGHLPNERLETSNGEIIEKGHILALYTYLHTVWFSYRLPLTWKYALELWWTISFQP